MCAHDSRTRHAAPRQKSEKVGKSESRKRWKIGVRTPPARHCGGEVRGARRAAEQGLQELIELEASQATKTDHTEAEVLAEAERLRAEEEARLAGEAAARAAEEAARLLAKQCARDKRQ